MLQAVQHERESTRGVSFSELDLGSDDAIRNFLRSRWNSRTQRRAQLERQWYINLAYYLGLQYYEWMQGPGGSGKLFLPPAPPYRVRLVCNRIQPIVRGMVARFLKQKPTWQTAPATDQHEDEMRSEISTKLLQSAWKVRGFDTTLIEWLTWVGVTGNGFIRASWDPTEGPALQIGPDDLGLMDGDQEDGLKAFRDMLGIQEEQETPGSVERHVGDVCYEVLSPFEVDPDSMVSNLAGCRFVIETKIRTVSEIRDRYGEKVDPDSDAEEALSAFYLKRISSFAGVSGGGSYQDIDTDTDDEGVIEHTLWVNPTKDHPQGLWVTATQGKILARGELETEDKASKARIPMMHLKEIHVPGRFWGTSGVEQIIHLQQDYNRGRSQIVENRNLVSKPKWAVAKGAGILDNALTSEPGEVVEYNWPFKPELIQPPQLPEYVMKSLEQTITDMEDIVAQRDVSKARLPSGARSGVAIAQLQEQDDSIHAPAMIQAEEALSWIGVWTLQLYAKHVSEERLIKIVGEDDQLEVITFTGQDLYGERTDPGVDYFDVRVQMGSQLPLSKAARLEFIIQLVQYGILHPQVDREMILHMLQLGSEQPAMKEAKLDKNAVLFENLQMAQGTMIEVNPWDNHEIHLEHHRRFQKSPRFRDLVQQFPMVVQLFESHIGVHVAILQEQAMLQAGGGMEGEGPPQESGGPEGSPPQSDGEPGGAAGIAM